MDLKTQSVARAMKETLHSPVSLPGLVPLLFEELHHRLVDRRRRHPGAYHLQRHILSRLHRRVKSADRFAGAAPHHRPREISEITCLLRARKNIEDDRFMGAQRAMARLVRITALFAARNNRVTGESPRLDNRRIDRGAQSLRRERRGSVYQLPAFAGLRCPQHPLGGSHPRFGHAQRLHQLAYLNRGLLFAFREKTPPPGSRPNLAALQVSCQPEWEFLRHHHLSNAPLMQHCGDHLGKTRPFDPGPSKLPLVMAQRQHPAMWRLLTRPIDLQIAHHDIRPSAGAQVDEWVGNKHAGRIQHIRVVLAGGDQQQVLRAAGIRDHF